MNLLDCSIILLINDIKLWINSTKSPPPLPSLSSGYTWCGANEVASHPKTPTLEKAAALDKGLSEPSLAPSLVEEEEFPTRSRVAALKQMSVASIASLRQRLSESRKIFDRKISQHTVSYFSCQEIFH